MVKQKQNSAMRRLTHRMRPRTLPSSLKGVLRKGLVIEDGCVFLGEFAGAKHTGDGTKGAREWSINHLHIDDYLPRTKRTRESQLSIGLRFGKELVSLLDKNREFGPFRVVVSMDADDGDKNLISCVVRFYRKRKGEVVMSDNLDGYKLEAIQVTDIR